MALTCPDCERAGVNCICPPKFKRLIAKTQIAPNRKCAEDRLIEMGNEPCYVSGYMVGFVGDDDFSVVGLYDHGDALVGPHKEVFVLEDD